MLYKKTIIVWASSREAANDAGYMAIQSARTLADATAFGTPVVEVANASDDPDFDPIVGQLGE